jgi:hypothetical protein
VTETYERSGQLTCATSEHLLARFFTNGSLDEELFRSTIGTLVGQARESVMKQGRPGRVRAFREMVSQIRTSDPAATARLEQLWAAVINEQSVALLCTYALSHIEDHLPDLLVALHTYNLERESLA